jgi:hypothetical protein
MTKRLAKSVNNRRFTTMTDFSNMSLQEVYALLAPEQRAAIAQQFQAALQQSPHPDGQQLSQIDPTAATAEDVAKMHEHAVQHHKGALDIVLRHPVMTAALAAFAIYELDKHLGKK